MRRAPVGRIVRVGLRFQPRWRPLVVQGAKTATCRQKRYGRPGDEFMVEGVRFRLVEVVQMPLPQARDTCYRSEGMASPEEFEAVWRENHPTRGFDADLQVWVHRFERVDHPPK